MKRFFAMTLSIAITLSALSSCSVVETLFDSEIPTYRDHYRDELKAPPSIDVVTDAKINSLDKLNYYGAVRVLSGIPMSISSLADYGEDIPENPTESNDGENTTEPPSGGVEVNKQNTIYYYNISEDERFYFNSISMFQIELTDADGFLASRLGTGVVDVVISEDCIWGDSLITFRNGDKFFSCLSNGKGYNNKTGVTTWDFSTHKYVDGFYIVKNIEQENYAFYIEIQQEGTVVSFKCAESENGGDHIDRNVKIASSTIIYADAGSFTAAELEAYFKQKYNPTDPEKSDNV